MYRFLILFFLLSFTGPDKTNQLTAWIRINQLGYTPGSVKIAVWCSKERLAVSKWQLFDAETKKIVSSGSAGKDFGAYGPFTKTYRLNFSSFSKPGRYYLQAGGIQSPVFEIGEEVYKGAADFCLRYMRQQRSGFNPFLKDSCHTHDGYILYGEKAGVKDSTHIDVVGGWHDASDYLQYSATSANAAYHLLMAYRDFPTIFADEKQANGLDGKNGIADVLDEAKWGLNWLLKMHPEEDRMFNQVADDRDHLGMRIPGLDSFYGKGAERPVYFVSGEPQQRGTFMNATTGTSSTAGKFVSAFSLGAEIFSNIDSGYSDTLMEHSFSALDFMEKKWGVTQTASVRSPYIYAEENWVDDVELAMARTYSTVDRITNKKGEKAGKQTKKNLLIDAAYSYAQKEKITPWLGADTAKHYQWYPFINIGHYELARQLAGDRRDTITGFYKEGIQRIRNKAGQNAFYRGIPFIWCSNNLTVSFAIQCYWYRQLTGDKTFSDLEQANFDWLFGCNPWGTSMVYGLPAWGDTPVDPHSAFTHLKNYPVDGGLVDGPVYGSIYNNLIGISLYKPDEYAAFQSGLAVYHDDYGDYSTNEPTMDGTASLIYLLAAKESEATSPASPPKEGPIQKSVHTKFLYNHGAIIRGDSSQKKLALVFTGDEFADGGAFISGVLKKEKIKASFFFTGNFFRNKSFSRIITNLKNENHYIGPHSDQHLLYCDWNKRDSLLVTKKIFEEDLENNFETAKNFGVTKKNASFFLPPFEWFNEHIANWTNEMGLELINFTPGTRSNADYTIPADKNYSTSKEIFNSVINAEKSAPAGLNGFILLLHIGTDPKRTDKFYYLLPQLIKELKANGYQFQTVDQLLKTD